MPFSKVHVYEKQIKELAPLKTDTKTLTAHLTVGPLAVLPLCGPYGLFTDSEQPGLY